MHVLLPYIRCVIGMPIGENNELDQAIAEGYNEIYMTTPLGIMKYDKLRPGKDGAPRFICSKVESIPGVTIPKDFSAIQFLPEGRVPYKLLEEVKAFFRKVIEVKGKALEAMIWVLWSQDRGYFLHVPNQEVGHASARYDWASVPEGASVIVDIHSHADFSAFFSGTDDRDDANGIRYSGVIGHNNTASPSMVWRFNNGGQKTKVELSDIFDAPLVPDTAVPGEWLEQVSVHTAPPALTPLGRGKGSWMDQFSKETEPEVRYGKGVWRAGSSIKEYEMGTPSRNSKGQFLPRNGKGRTRDDDDTGHPPGYYGGLLPDSLWNFNGDGVDPLTGEIYEDVRVLPDGSIQVIPGDPVGGSNSYLENGYLDQIAAQHGVEAAERFNEITDNLLHLDHNNELLAEIAGDAFGFMSEDARLAAFKGIYNTLPESDKMKLAQTGL
jgi:proteasome lid subunit RPN8/RPN11